MLVLSNTLDQTIAANAPLVFNTEIIRTGSGCNCNSRGINRIPHVSAGVWEVEFHGNIGATTETTEVSLAIAVDGVILPETRMDSSSEAAGEINNVSAATIIKINGCKCTSAAVTVVNVGTVPVNIEANPALILKRIG